VRQEDDLLEQINLEVIEKKLFENMVNFGKFFETKKRLNSVEISGINRLLKECSRLYNIKIFDCIIYIDFKFVDLKKIVNVLDDDNKELLKTEIRDMYDMKVDVPKIFKFLK
jgi:hypothetical protein